LWCKLQCKKVVGEKYYVQLEALADESLELVHRPPVSWFKEAAQHAEQTVDVFVRVA
jgi:hypothetical protein